MKARSFNTESAARTFHPMRMEDDELNTSWRELVIECMAEHSESWADVEATTLSNEELDRRRYSEHGGVDGEDEAALLNVWTARSVYVGTGEEYRPGVRWIPRHPPAEDHTDETPITNSVSNGNKLVIAKRIAEAVTKLRRG